MKILSILCMATVVLIGCVLVREKPPAIDTRAVELSEQELEEARSRAIEVADSAWALTLESSHDDAARYEREIVEDSISFKIYYQLKDPMILGGGCMIRVSKRDLSVIGGEMYE